MQLRRLRVRNVRSYESADLELGPGTTLLSGDVGSGKTSLLYAIEMALFGFAEVDPTFLVRHQAGDAEVSLALADEVHRYEFARRFRRRRRKGRDVFELESASYAVDGATSSYSVTEIRQRAISLLGFPDNPNPRAHSDLWRWAVYVPQERMREVLAQDTDERLETVRKALGLEQYRTAAENAQLVAAELRRMAEHAEAEARGRDHLVDEGPTLASAIAEHEAQLRRSTLENERLAQDLRTAEALLEELDSRRQAVERDRGEERQLIDRVQADEVRLAALAQREAELAVEEARLEERRRTSNELGEQRDALVAELRATDERLAALRTERDHRAKEIAELAAAEAHRSGLSEALAHAHREADGAGREAASASEDLARRLAELPLKEPPAPTPRSLVDLDGESSAARTAVEGNVAAISRLEQVAQENEELRTAGVCPRCHQRVDPTEFAAHFQEVAGSLVRERAALEGARRKVEALAEERRSRERYERNHQRWADLEAARAAARARVDRATAATEAIDRRVNELTDGLRAAEETVSRLRPAAEAVKSLLAEVTRAEQDRATEERRLTALGQALEAAQGAGAALERLGLERQRGARERASLAQEIEARQRTLETVRRRLADLPRLADSESAARGRRDLARRAVVEAERSRERAQTLLETVRARAAEVATLLTERQSHLDAARGHRELAEWLSSEFREEVLALEHRLLARAQAEFERDFARFFHVLVEDPALIARCDSAFSPAVEIDGEWTPAEALSGGERTALALAFRLALGQVVRSAGRLKLATLILDEPTDGFSPEQVVRMGELLEGLGIPQVILVSHETQLTAIADRVVRVQKDGGRSRLLFEDRGDAPGPPPKDATPALAASRRRVRSPRLDAGAAEGP